MIRKIVTLAEIQVQKLDELMELEGAASVSEVIRHAINAYYDSAKPRVPPYIRMAQAKKTPVEKAREKVQEEIAKIELKEEVTKTLGMEIADQLYNRELLTDATGNISCKFPTYSMLIPGRVEQGEMVLPLEQLTKDMILMQFDGKKEEILKIIKK